DPVIVDPFQVSAHVHRGGVPGRGRVHVRSAWFNGGWSDSHGFDLSCEWMYSVPDLLLLFPWVELSSVERVVVGVPGVDIGMRYLFVGQLPRGEWTSMIAKEQMAQPPRILRVSFRVHDVPGVSCGTPPQLKNGRIRCQQAIEFVQDCPTVRGMHPDDRPVDQRERDISVPRRCEHTIHQHPGFTPLALNGNELSSSGGRWCCAVGAACHHHHRGSSFEQGAYCWQEHPRAANDQHSLTLIHVPLL